MLKTPQEIIDEYAEKQKIREQNILANKGKASKTDKKKLLVLQDGRCAFCKETIPATGQVCFDKKTKTVICRPCMMYLTTWRNYRAKGITEADTVEFGQ